MESDFFNQPYLNRQFIRFKENQTDDKTLYKSIDGIIGSPLTAVLTGSVALMFFQRNI